MSDYEENSLDSSPTEEGTKPTTDTEGDCNSPMNDGVEKEKNPGEEATDKESLDDSGEAKKDESDDDDDGPPNEYKKKAKKLQGIMDEMKGFVYRTDISATEKVNNVKRLLDEAQDKPPAPPKVEEKPAAAESIKRPSEDTQNGQPQPKMFKHFLEGGDDDEEGKAKNSDDEDGVIDSCVVCGLYLEVFKEDKDKELQHYLSHGFNILKEFEILKPDDSLFLCCNLCSSVYPKKCHVNYRKHLVSDHTDRIVEIFREI